MSDLPAQIFKRYGVTAIIVAVVMGSSIWGLAHRAASAGSEVSVLWGLVRYTKSTTDVSRESRAAPEAKTPPAQVADSDAIAAVRHEAAALLKMTRDKPGGLWLMAEATTGERDSLLRVANQLKPEYRAKALAHLAYALTVFDRSEDAQYIAERSLAAIVDVPAGLRGFALAEVAEKFAEAQLNSIALRAAEQALKEAKASGSTDGLQRLARVFVRTSSVNKALAAFQGIEEPKARSDALSEIVDYLIEAGQNDDAMRVFREALSSSLAIPKAIDRGYALVQRTRELSQLGRYEEASKVAQQAREARLLIKPEESFGELSAELVKTETNLFMRPPEEIMLIAERQRVPEALVRLAWAMPKRSDETARVVGSALTLAKEARDPYLMMRAVELLYRTGSIEKAAEAAKRATEMALQVNEPRIRDAALEKAAEILAESGDFDAAIEAVDGIVDVKNTANAVIKVVSRRYVQKGETGGRAVKIVNRACGASESLEDQERSDALMRLAASQAFLGNHGDACRTANQVPLSAYRLAAYSMVVFAYEIQRWPELQRGKLRGNRNDFIMMLLAPVFHNWNLDS